MNVLGFQTEISQKSWSQNLKYQGKLKGARRRSKSR